MNISCPKCNQKYEIEKEQIGETVTCQQCELKFKLAMEKYSPPLFRVFDIFGILCMISAVISGIVCFTVENPTVFFSAAASSLIFGFVFFVIAKIQNVISEIAFNLYELRKK